MMRTVPTIDLPPKYIAAERQGRKLAWITIVYMISVIILMFLVMGNSQAMWTAWIEDIIMLIPPAAFLISSKARHNPPDARFLYGYHRSVSIAYLSSSLALFAVGCGLLIENTKVLLTAEHPTIGTVSLFGNTVWQGALMVPVLFYAAIPAVFLGRRKIELAEKLHDKSLYADAEMNRADWMTAGAALGGLTGIYYGYWWADAVAAVIISIDVVRDGWKNLKNSIGDLMDRAPLSVQGKPLDDLEKKMRLAIDGLDWVCGAEFRLRESGTFFLGEAFVWVNIHELPEAPAKQIGEILRCIDWRILEVSIQFEAAEPPFQKTMNATGS